MLTDNDVSKAAMSLTTIGWGKTKPVVLNRKRKTWTQWQAEKWSETKWQFFPCICTRYSFHVTFYMVFSIWFCSNRHTYSFSSTVALHSSEKQIRPGLIRGFYLPCPQWAGFCRFTRKNNGWFGEEMKRCHRSSTVSNCVHAFPFPNNPPQCPPPLIIFLFLSHSPCLSFSRLLLSPSPSSRLQLHYRIITVAGPHNMDSVTCVSLSRFTPSLCVCLFFFTIPLCFLKTTSTFI